MRLIAIAACTLFIAARAAAADYSTAADKLRVQHCDVVIAEEADLSPRETGILKKIAVKKETQVDAGQIVFQLEDTKAQAELNVAKAKLFAAKTKADDDINIRYATKAAEVAVKELDYNTKSNQRMAGSVPQARIDELELKCKETSLGIEKAKHDRAVAQAEAGIADAEANAAQMMIELLEVKSPINGVVVDVRAHEGEAVGQPGQPGVVHIVGLDRVWVQGQVSARDVARSQLEKQPVKVEVESAPGQKVQLDGEINFVSPLTNSGGTYQVQAEVRQDRRNGPPRLYPGMQAAMIITLKPAEAR
jgi:multidrug resistance efflux pump